MSEIQATAPSGDQSAVLDAIHNAIDEPTIRHAQQLVMQWLEANPNDPTVPQAAESLAMCAALLGLDEGPDDKLLPAPAKTRYPLSDEQIAHVQAILRQAPGFDILPPYEGLSEEDAVLVRRYQTGQEPIDARFSVHLSRKGAAQTDT